MPLTDPLPDHRCVAVLGLGLTGRAVCRLLAHFGKRVLALDSRADADPGPMPTSVRVHPGSMDVEDATAVVLSPSLHPLWPANREKPDLAPIYQRWDDGEIQLLTEVDVALAAWDGDLLAIGGTDGKSTTAALAHHLLNGGGVAAPLGGNSWTPLSAVLLDHPDARYVVAEISAFQLWRPHGFAPRVALLTNVAPDHLDHFASEEDYYDAKHMLLDNLERGDVAVLNGGDARVTGWGHEVAERGVTIRGFAGEPDGAPWDLHVAEPDGPRLRFAGNHAWDLDLSEFRLPGAHNRRNLLSAVLAMDALCPAETLDMEAIGAALGTFRGLPHRVQFVAELDGVRYYDDSKATNVHAAVTGIRAFDAPLVALVGGVDKDLELGALIETLRARANHVLAFGELRERLVREARGTLTIEPVETLDLAVARAKEVARRGDVVLLAPACSSFDQFRSFEHRGEVYQRLVRSGSRSEDGAVG